MNNLPQETVDIISEFVEENKLILMDPDKVAGECDSISIKFLDRIKSGYLLCCGIPTREPTLGWKFFGDADSITHYVVVLGEFVIDFTARQFWDDSEVPMVMSASEFEMLWSDIAWDHDARIDLRLDGLL